MPGFLPQLFGNIRLVLDAEVQAGNQTATSFAQPEPWKFLDSLPAELRPVFLRGDCGWGTETMMAEAEERKVPYRLKLNQTSKVKQLIENVFSREDCSVVEAGKRWKR